MKNCVMFVKLVLKLRICVLKCDPEHELCQHFTAQERTPSRLKGAVKTSECLKRFLPQRMCRGVIFLCT